MPDNQAKLIFERSLVSLMAHSIRGVVNHFLRHGVELDIKVIARQRKLHLQLGTKQDGATSVLSTRFTPGSVRTGGGLDRVTACIFIRRDANKNLARICIAHEIYHLLKELETYIARRRTAWLPIPQSPELEADCNVFAWRLCYYHNRFNNDDVLRKKHVTFPEELFVQTFNMTNIRNLEQWAKGVALDPNHPFYELDPPGWINELPQNE